MDVVKVYPPYLYAIRYAGDQLHIYDLVQKRLTNLDYLENFFEVFQESISDFIVAETGIPIEETQEYIDLVSDQMYNIREDIRNICKSLLEGDSENFGNLFKIHSENDIREMPEGGGASSHYSKPYLPVKCYGTKNHPPLVRIYAIEMSLDCYIIIYGGIKLNRKTNTSPAFDEKGNKTFLEDEIRRRVIAVCDFLASKGILDKDGLIEYMEEDHEEHED